MNHLAKLEQVLPKDRLGPLKDMASQTIMDSAKLEGGVAPATAHGLGEQLRLLNAFHSNLIEGHKTGILDIRKALDGEYSQGENQRYAQELCAAHVVAEREMMGRIASGEANPFDVDFLPGLHERFYSQLPPEHQYCHGGDGFTEHPVMPGHFRDRPVTVDGDNQLGPAPEGVPSLFEALLRLYSPEVYHGDERLLAILSMHHRLAWIHPFRDGNGRMVRLHTAAAMAYVGINAHSLWSLARGLSRNKTEYYIHLRFADLYEDEHLADFLELCLEQCLDQIAFIGKLLRLDTMEARIEKFLGQQHDLASMSGDAKFSRAVAREKLPSLLSEVFRCGTMQRMRVYEILGLGRKAGAQVIKPLLERGILVTDSPRGPLKFGFPEDAMPSYFPHLYEPSIMRDVDANKVVFTDPVYGTLLRAGDRAMVASVDGTASDVGSWRRAYEDLLSKRVKAFVFDGEMQVVEA